MGITSSNKQIDQSRIDCDGSLQVSLALSAAPDIISNPTDIVLILDRSGSMAGSPLANLKEGAKAFIDILSESTGGAPDSIGSGSRIGIVSFADTATADTQLITSVEDLKNAVDSLSAGGNTNHAAAFTKASELFDPMSSNARVMVMFTDGKTTAGPPPTPVADAAKADGVIIYCIGLVGSGGINVATLELWASQPPASYVLVTPDDADLEALFRELAQNISKTGATDIVIDEVVAPDFLIVSMSSPTKGTATMLDSRTIQWKISELGVSANEGAALDFRVRHISQEPGVKAVNASITYSDSEGNTVVFPDPQVTVECAVVVVPEACPKPVDFDVERCQDAVVIDAGDVYLESTGRIVQLDAVVKQVCPGKEVALAILLSELDENGQEHQRGMKAFTLPAHNYPTCRDVVVRCVKFVVPEGTGDDGDPNSLCRVRRFRARLIAHNVNTDYACCQSDVTVL